MLCVGHNVLHVALPWSCGSVCLNFKVWAYVMGGPNHKTQAPAC